MSNFLEKTGLQEIYDYNEFDRKSIKLRDGRDAILWVNKNDNHGILDPEFWENPEFYYEEYRNQFSANLDNFTSSKEHLKVYKDINKRQFNQFKNKLNKDTKFLEIGSSFGGVLQHVNKNKLKTIHAIEPNRQDSEFTSFKFKNSIVFNSFFEAFNFDTKYNMIVSFEVLEHIFDLSKFIKKLFDILEEGGKLNFEVPNHNDALLVNYKSDYYQSFYYHKSHVHYFTPESLIKIFKHFGIYGEVDSFQMYPFFNQIFWMYNNKPQSSASEAFKYPCTIDENVVNKKIYKFFKKTDRNYQKLMSDKLCGDCLIFRGIKNKI